MAQGSGISQLRIEGIVSATLKVARQCELAGPVLITIEDKGEYLVLLRHKFLRTRRAVEARQHGHRGKTLTRASMMRRRTVAIEFGT